MERLSVVFVNASPFSGNNRLQLYSALSLQMSSIKCVAIGDSGVGKSCLLLKFADENFNVDTENENRNYKINPKFNEYWVPVRLLEGKTMSLHLCDTSGSDSYQCTRQAQYSSADIILICFSVVDRQSFESVRQRWIPELFESCPYKPSILVGTKTDLVEIKAESLDMDGECITYGEGWCMARDINAFAYIECTAVLDLDISVVFDMAIECVQQKRAKNKAKLKPEEPRKCLCCKCPIM